MSLKNKSPIPWIVSFVIHGVFFLILAYWGLPRLVAIKGVGQEVLVVELNIAEPIEEPKPPPPEPIIPEEEVITTDHQEAEPVAMIEPKKEEPPAPKPVVRRPPEPPKIKKPSPLPPQTVERGAITEADPSEILKQIKPRYPSAAIRAGHEGTVTLHLKIDANGTLSHVQIKRSSGREDCDRAAVDALQRWWRFRAKGIPYERSLNIHFKLD